MICHPIKCGLLRIFPHQHKMTNVCVLLGSLCLIFQKYLEAPLYHLSCSLKVTIFKILFVFFSLLNHFLLIGDWLN